MPLGNSATSGDFVKDFVHSKNKKFKGKSKAERIRMALGAYYGKKNEDVQFVTFEKPLDESDISIQELYPNVTNPFALNWFESHYIKPYPSTEFSFKHRSVSYKNEKENGKHLLAHSNHLDTLHDPSGTHTSDYETHHQETHRGGYVQTKHHSSKEAHNFLTGLGFTPHKVAINGSTKSRF